MRISFLAALALAAAPIPAAALIQTVAFHGVGRVTYVDSDPQFQPPTVGAPVIVTGSLDLGPASVADTFTGTVIFDEDLLFSRDQSFSWTVQGGRAGANSKGFAYAGGIANFVAGRLTAVSIYNDYDSDIQSLTPTRWSVDYPYSESGWGGTWALSVPEPASWALMIAGFGLVGIASRRKAETRA